MNHDSHTSSVRCPHCRAEIANPRWPLCPQCGAELPGAAQRLSPPSHHSPLPTARPDGESEAERAFTSGPGAPGQTLQSLKRLVMTVLPALFIIAYYVVKIGLRTGWFQGDEPAPIRPVESHQTPPPPPAAPESRPSAPPKPTATARSNHDQNAQAFNLYKQGTAEMKQNRLPEAEECFTRAIELSPRYYSAYFSRGVVRRQRGNLDGALADFDQSLTIKPDRYQTWVERAIVCRLQNRNEEFQRSLEKAASLRGVAPDKLAPEIERRAHRERQALLPPAQPPTPPVEADGQAPAAR